MKLSVIDVIKDESPETLADLGPGVYLVDLLGRRLREMDVLVTVCNGSFTGIRTSFPTDIRGWSSLPGAQILASACKIANVRKVDIKALSLVVTRKL